MKTLFWIIHARLWLSMQNKCGSVYFADFDYLDQTLPYLRCLPN